jgi:lysyl-tRNA synthetase class 2
MDEEFCEAMECRSTSYGWMGNGYRLTMFLTDNHNIKEVILFPAMRPLDRDRKAQIQQLRLADTKEIYKGNL